MIMKHTQHHIQFKLNGNNTELAVHASDTLLTVLRDRLELKGTKPGCHEGECGACTVLIDGAPVNSCLYLAVNANGKEVTTIEGLQHADGKLDPVQESLVNNGAVQCGFCTSGMAMAIKGLVNEYEHKHQVPGTRKFENPSRDEIKKWLEGNLCRCTGYVKIIDAAETLFRD